MVEQLSLFDQDIWSGKTYPARSQVMEGRTSRQFSQKSQESYNRSAQTCLCLVVGVESDGIRADTSSMKWEDGALLGDYMTLSFGELPSEERESLLSQILEVSAPQKYYLSAKACIGILNRSKRKGKPLPEQLKQALERQSVSKKEQGNQGGGKGILIQDEKVATLSTVNNQAVAFFTNDAYDKFSENEISATLRANGGIYNGGSETLVVYEEAILVENHPSDSRIKLDERGVVQTLSSRMGTGGNNTPMVLENLEVRRMTPLECERLQGYPDGWTDIGEWIDTNGKVHKESPDSARYKALGNSIALPFWKFLARRICAQYEHEITMGSLFDGIGGFPYSFEKAGAKAVWASEIEEFPIAVTKRHFPEVDDESV